MKRKSKHKNAGGQPDFCDYGVGILGQRLDKLLEQTEGAKSGNDTRAIHQMRVWSRRSRAALDVFGACFAGKTAEEFACLEQEVKAVTRALGAARDLDVMIETLQTRAENLPAAQHAGAESFLNHLHAQRADRQTAVTKAVCHLESRHLKKLLSHLAERQGYAPVTLNVSAVPAPAAATVEDVKNGTGLTTHG